MQPRKRGRCNALELQMFMKYWWMLNLLLSKLQAIVSEYSIAPLLRWWPRLTPVFNESHSAEIWDCIWLVRSSRPTPPLVTALAFSESDSVQVWDCVWLVRSSRCFPAAAGARWIGLRRTWHMCSYVYCSLFRRYFLGRSMAIIIVLARSVFEGFVEPSLGAPMRNGTKSHGPLIETLEIAPCVNLKANNSGSYLSLSKITEYGSSRRTVAIVCTSPFAALASAKSEAVLRRIGNNIAKTPARKSADWDV